MERPLVVLIGAGASAASGDYTDAERPPLTRELFDPERAGDLLRTYTLAQAADIAMRTEMEIDTAVQLEDALRRLQNDGFRHHRQMALGVPPFLQALLLGYSRQLAAYAHRYARLVDQLLRIPVPVHFVSFNYDTLLDHHLNAFTPLNTLDDYIDTALGWKLIKPHGSIAWFVAQERTFDPTSPPLDWEFAADPIECVPVRDVDLASVRNTVLSGDHAVTSRYPALAIPDGPKDRLVLPDAHYKALVDVLCSQEIQLLILGYSGLDTEVFELMKHMGCTIRRLTVVNRSGADALEVYDRVEGLGIKTIHQDVVDMPLSEWIDGSGLRTWVAEYNGTFESLTWPDHLRAAIEEREPEPLLEIRTSRPDEASAARPDDESDDPQPSDQ